MVLYFNKSIPCEKNYIEALNTIKDAIMRDPSFCLESQKQDEAQIVFHEIIPFGLYHNSFAPDVQLTTSEDGEGSILQMSFRIRSGARVVLSCVLILLCFMQIGCLKELLSGGSRSSFVQFLPAILIVYTLLMSSVLLRISSIRIIDFIKKAIN